MWGKVDEVTQSIERFTELSLLEVGVKKIQLTPTMLKFIEENIDHRSKNEYMESISDFYNQLLGQSYEQISKKSNVFEKDFTPKKSTSLVSTFTKVNMQEQLRIISGQNTILEQLSFEFRNIIYCLNFFIDMVTLHDTSH